MTRTTAWGHCALLMACLATACGGDGDSVTSPTVVAQTPVTFAGSLPVGGERFYSFSTAAGGTVGVLLASVTSSRTGRPVERALDIALGIPAGTGCAPRTAATLTAGLTAQLSIVVEAGTFCVSVADRSGLADSIDFALRFTYP